MSGAVLFLVIQKKRQERANPFREERYLHFLSIWHNRIKWLGFFKGSIGYRHKKIKLTVALAKDICFARKVFTRVKTHYGARYISVLPITAAHSHTYTFADYATAMKRKVAQTNIVVCFKMQAKLHHDYFLLLKG
ncbi:MAG: hypothetical protein GC136_06635 [Alphaproteobacteria bacterium]|nr:hypothetical protein [Alphaproteobacteria bacterium]